VNPFAVVEPFDVIEDRGSCFVACAKVAMVNQFILQSREEALRHSIILRHLAAIHACRCAMRSEQSPVRRRVVLRAAIGVVDESIIMESGLAIQHF